MEKDQNLRSISWWFHFDPYISTHRVRLPVLIGLEELEELPGALLAPAPGINVSFWRDLQPAASEGGGLVSHFGYRLTVLEPSFLTTCLWRGWGPFKTNCPKTYMPFLPHSADWLLKSRKSHCSVEPCNSPQFTGFSGWMQFTCNIQRKSPQSTLRAA